MFSRGVSLSRGVSGIVLAMLAVVTLGAQGPTDLVNRTVRARVVAVLDGDTMDVVIPPNRRERVRLHGADTPEAREPFSNAARSFARGLLSKREVTLHGRDVDTYGRLVARVAVDGRDASEALIAAGLACTFRRFSSDPVLIAAFNRARNARAGFWAPNAQQPACVARELDAAARGGPPAARPQPAPRGGTARPDPNETGAARGPFTGNVQSRVYHAPTCRNATCRNCTRRFATRAEAETAGFRPAGDCLR